MGVFNSLFGDQLDDANFGHKVAAGEMIEVEPGKFQSREAAEWPLAALADSNAQGREKPESNTSGAFLWSGSSGEDGLNRFRDFFSSRRRDD